MNEKEAPFHSALLVEDEPSLATGIEIALKRVGIPVTHASRIADARKLVFEMQPEFILLDRSLPDGDGIDLCRELRQSGYRGAILMLTAMGQIEERVKGLESGADDYLPKPFKWEELHARIYALSRRKAGFQGAFASLDPWETDESRLRIRGPNGWVDLTPLEYKLVKHLMDSNGAIVTRDDLLKDVWGFTLLPKTRTVDHFMGRLRKLFEKNAEDPQHFLTVRGAGYRFQK